LAISKARKQELVAQYKELIEGSKAVFLADYTGMSVKDMEALRAKVDEANGAFHVAKNTLFKLALIETDNPVPEAFFTGQVAVGFAIEETPAMAKVMVDYAKDVDTFRIKGGVFNASILSSDDVEALAKLPSLPELRSQLIGLLNAPAQNVVSVVTNGVRQVINVIDAYSKKEETAEAEPA
jgi:large subunit ribosomal protein L10